MRIKKITLKAAWANRHSGRDKEHWGQRCLSMYFYHYKSSAVVFGYLKKCFLYFYFVFFIFVYNMFHCVLSCVRCVVRTSEKVCKGTINFAYMQIFTVFFLIFHISQTVYSICHSWKLHLCRLIFELIVRDKLVVTWKFVDGYYTFRIPSIYLPYTFCDIYTINYFRINQEVVCLLLYK